MSVQLIETGKNWRKVVVNREQFEAWLAQPGHKGRKGTQICEWLSVGLSRIAILKEGRVAARLNNRLAAPRCNRRWQKLADLDLCNRKVINTVQQSVRLARTLLDEAMQE
jgi:SH3-like domain-containing protein